jgi:hypothetical protein
MWLGWFQLYRPSLGACAVMIKFAPARIARVPAKPTTIIISQPIALKNLTSAPDVANQYQSIFYGEEASSLRGDTSASAGLAGVNPSS